MAQAQLKCNCQYNRVCDVEVCIIIIYTEQEIIDQLEVLSNLFNHLCCIP